jgi:hypothetical protein
MGRGVQLGNGSGLRNDFNAFVVEKGCFANEFRFTDLFLVMVVYFVTTAVPLTIIINPSTLSPSFNT